AADTQPCGMAPRLSCADIELPAVPGTREDLSLARILHLPGNPRLQQPPRLALAQGPALMRTAVAQGEELPAEVEDPDGQPSDPHDFAAARRDLVRRRHDVPRHQRPGTWDFAPSPRIGVLDSLRAAWSAAGACWLTPVGSAGPEASNR